MSRPNLHKMQTPSRPFTHQPHPNSLFPVRRRPCKTPPPQRPPKPTPAPPQRPLPSPVPRVARTRGRGGSLLPCPPPPPLPLMVSRGTTNFLCFTWTVGSPVARSCQLTALAPL